MPNAIQVLKLRMTESDVVSSCQTLTTCVVNGVGSTFRLPMIDSDFGHYGQIVTSLLTSTEFLPLLVAKGLAALSATSLSHSLLF